MALQVLTLPFIRGERKIYVRSIYTDFFLRILTHRTEIMRNEPHSQEGLGIAFTGTPRTGKSCFLIYVAHMLQENNINFVITMGRRTYNSSFEVADITKDLDNSSIVHLIDPTSSSCVFDIHAAIPVFFASPTTSNFNPYHLKHLFKYFMPLWTMEELRDAHSKLGYTFHEDLFLKWGGVFLDTTRSELLHQNLKDVLKSQMLHKLLQVVDHFALSPEIEHCQWLIHRVPCEDYMSCRSQLPSEFVRREILKVLQSGTVLEYPSDSVLMGHIYERKVLQLLEKNTPNIVMKAHSERCKSISDIMLEVLNVAYFTNSCVIKEPTIKTLYEPKESNKEGLDAIYVLSKEVAFIIQATINRAHKPINVSSVCDTMPNIITWNVCLFYGGNDSSKVRFPQVLGLNVTEKNKYICKDIKLLSV